MAVRTLDAVAPDLADHIRREGRVWGDAAPWTSKDTWSQGDPAVTGVTVGYERELAKAKEQCPHRSTESEMRLYRAARYCHAAACETHWWYWNPARREAS